MATPLSNQVSDLDGSTVIARGGKAVQAGTAAQNAAFTGELGEITYDTTDDRLVGHDGSTAGGFPLALETEVTADAADRLPAMGGATYAAGLGTVATLGVAVKLVAVTTAKGNASLVTVGTDNTFTAAFTDARVLRVQGRFDVDVASGTDNLTMHIFVNGASVFETAAQSVAAATLKLFEFDVLLTVAATETIEIYVENEDTTANITSAAYSDRLDLVPSHGWVQITG